MSVQLERPPAAAEPDLRADKSPTAGPLPVKQRMRSRRVLRWVANLLKILVALVVLFPILWMVVTAVKPQDEVVSFPPTLLPTHWEFGNFLAVETAGPFLRWYFNSLFVAAVIVAGNLVFGIPAAYAFARMRFRGKNLVFLVILGSLMIPGEVLLIPLFVLLARFGWVNTYLALTVPFLVNAFVIFLLKQFFESVPRELEEAAVIDGAGVFRILWYVVMPLSKPAIAVSAFFGFIGSWNSYLYPLIVTRTPDMRTVTVGLSLFKSESGSNWPLLMSAATLIAIPAVVAFLLIERHLKNTMAFSGLR
jgi:multiple sugar transport system permease protein